MIFNSVSTYNPIAFDFVGTRLMGNLNKYWRSLMSTASESSTLEDLRGLDCLLPAIHPNFKRPTPEQVSILVSSIGLSQSQVARLVGVVYTEKGSPTVRRWKTHVKSNEHRAIPYAAWRLLLEFSGLAETADSIEAAKKYF